MFRKKIKNKELFELKNFRSYGHLATCLLNKVLKVLSVVSGKDLVMKKSKKRVIEMFDFVIESLYRALLFCSFCVLGMMIWVYWEAFLLLTFVSLGMCVVSYFDKRGG